MTTILVLVLLVLVVLRYKMKIGLHRGRKVIVLERYDYKSYSARENKYYSSMHIFMFDFPYCLLICVFVQ